MATGTPKKESTAEDADDRTQQIPLVEGPVEDALGSNGALKSEPEADKDTVVPQETVPMPVATWPPPTLQAPSKPPSLRVKETRPEPALHTGQIEGVPRPGILTGELRRALPPWALPLLDSQPVTVWLGARIGVTLLALLAGLMLPSIDPRGTANWYGSPGGPTLTPFVDHIAGVWTRWDGQWYLKIATEGYHRDDGSAAFFPLYPWILQVTGWLAGERYIWAGILISSAFFLAALVLLHRLVRIDFHPDDAGRTVFYLAAFPMAFFFWAVYSESLFLFLAVGALLAARTRHWWWAALATSFAVWARSTGLILLLPMAWELWRAYHPPLPTDPRAMPPPRPHPLSVASLIVPLVSFAALLGWANLEFGDPLASLKAQTEWNRGFAWPWETVVNAVRAATQMPFQFQPENQSWTYLGALILALLVGTFALRWLRGSYSLYLWAGILVPLFSGTPRNPLLSYPRFLIVLFPAFMVLALAGRNRYVNQIVTWVSLLLLALFTIRFANWFWVA
jgi:hypothetical protein